MNGIPARDAAGNVVVSGALLGASLGRGTFVIRLDPSGTPDPSFGMGGMVTLWPAPPTACVFGPPTLQPDGRIVLAGSDDEATSFIRRLRPGRRHPIVITLCCVAAVQETVATNGNSPLAQIQASTKAGPSVGVPAPFRCSPLQSVARGPDFKRLLLYQLS